MKLLLLRSDGRVSLSSGSDVDQEIANFNDAHAIDGVSVVDVKEVGEDQLPSDHTFFNAWRPCDVKGVRHCMDAAREIQKDRIRAKRARRFSEADAAFTRALSTGRDASALAAMMQDLRDATDDPAIAKAATAEELANVWPEVLDRPIPSLGGVKLPDMVDPAVTQSLTDWANGLEQRLAGVEASTASHPVAAPVDLSPIAEELAKLQHAVGAGATMKDVQGVAAVMDALAQRLAQMETRQTLQEGRLKEAAARVDFVMKEGAGQAELTSEELVQ
jgi:hypothetical protein